MQYKAVDLHVKSTEKPEHEQGIIIAYASTFDREPDSYGDVVAKGAFAETLEDWAKREDSIPVLFGHRTDDPLMNIGVVKRAVEDEKGLLVEMQLDLDNERGAYSYKLVQEGRLSKLSFAFEVLQEEDIELEDGRKANELQKMNIFEVSLVPIPANQNTSVIEVREAPKQHEAVAKSEDDEQSENVVELLKRIDDILDKQM